MKIKLSNSSILQSQKSGLRGHGCSLHLLNQDRAEISKIGASNTSDNIKIKIKISNPARNLHHHPNPQL